MSSLLHLALLWAVCHHVADALRHGQGKAHSWQGLLGRAVEPEEAVALGDDADLGVGGEDRGGAVVLREPGAVEDVEAWLHMSHARQHFNFSLFLPLLRSLQEGLQKIGIASRAIDQNSSDEMVEGVRKAVARGMRPLVVTVGIFWASEATIRALRDCKDAGAYLVLYSTEPAWADEVYKMATDLGVQEVWEYAMSNIDRYSSEFKSRVPVRYLPPGYARQFEVGVDLRSPERQEGKVGFLGRLGFRPKGIQEMYEAMLGDLLNETYRVWSRRGLQSFLDTFPLQLNLHKGQTCCPHDESEPVAMEAFRMTSLLSNKACVVSTPVPESDRRRWEGIVHFAEANETLLALQELRKDVRGCQERAAALYKERFDPERLLRASGFLDAWQPSSPEI
uniref:Uncharacterized protein n=1 Tax=Alexandrium catenella TaxID=2925 RepID=A0A7S1S954_ALECA|mmetsp:Transcript_88756/g.235738  ORF Transcript_88756/g.235738 Transcript_88756/m.235738 type:complete len:393 (+) Transcript_88756:80-1258(+)